MHPALTPEIQNELRALLEANRDELQANIEALRSNDGADDTPLTDPSLDTPGDRGDASVDLEEWDENHQEEMDLLEQFDEVRHALSKFAQGTYGTCENCGKPIPLDRLQVLPEARFDIEHQRAAEAQ